MVSGLSAGISLAPRSTSDWTEHILDSETAGHPHDVVFGDVDGDGERELVANAMYCDTPGLFTYKVPRDADPTMEEANRAVRSFCGGYGDR